MPHPDLPEGLLRHVRCNLALRKRRATLEPGGLTRNVRYNLALPPPKSNNDVACKAADSLGRVLKRRISAAKTGDRVK